MYKTGKVRISLLAIVLTGWFLSYQSFGFSQELTSLGSHVGSNQDLVTADFEYSSIVEGKRARTSMERCGQLILGLDYAKPLFVNRDLDVLPRGFVWSIGKGMPARMKVNSDVVFGADVLVQPGVYFLSLRHDGDGQWSLLATRIGRGIEYRAEEGETLVIPMSSRATAEFQDELRLRLTPGQESSAQFEILWGPHSVATSLLQVGATSKLGCR
ncbi:MAG TPA: DUF2911 domain-containing protein [Acidobacteriota bacterium]|nr:DUF2911 domain-containing protein [Acidobacteriota bacterium]